MNKLGKVIFSLILFFIFLIGYNKAYAASASISASSRSVTVGTNVNVSAYVSATETYNLKMTASGGSLGGTTNSASAFGSEKSTTVLSGNFSASTPGTYTITLSGTIAGSDFNKQPVNKSITISVSEKANNGGNQGGSSSGNSGGNSGNSGSTGNQGGNTAPTKDGNANLSNLGIRPNDFSGFSSGKTVYSVNVPNDVTSISVYATPSSSKATVSGTGNKSLKPGTNKFSVVVTAQDGTQKTYTISVNRAGEDGESVPNVVDEEPIEGEEPSVGVGLESLVIEGLELDKEFKTEEHEYIVKVKNDLTLEELEAIKDKLAIATNTDKVSTEVVAEISEDGKRTITIIVKDDEKEYSRYVITFEKEEDKEETAAVLMTDNNSDGGDISKGIFGLSPEQQIYVVLGCFGVTLLMAVYFACIAYVKSKRLAEYEEGEFDEENENSEFEKMNQYYVGFEGNTNENMTRKEEVEDLGKNEFSEDTVEDVTSTLGKLGGYRSMRNKSKSAGRHF